MSNSVIVSSNRKKSALTTYVSRDVRNSLLASGFDVEKYHEPSPMDVRISNLMLVLAGIMEEIPLSPDDPEEA